MTAVLTIARSEARLLTREWAAMVFAFVFPPITMLIIAGSFGHQPDEEFANLIPSEYYVAGYIGVPIAAIALIALPVSLASYRERDVLRRFAAFGVPTRSVVGAQALVGAGLVVVAALTVAAAALPTYGIPAMARPVEVVIGFAAATGTLLAIGVALGLAVKSARGAQAIGLLAFFPMFLLSGGGPPAAVMSAPMRRVADVLPLTHAIGAIRDPWLDDGAIGGHLLALAVWLAAGLAGAAALIRRTADAG